MLKRAGHAETPYILGIVEFLLVLAPCAIWIGRGQPPSWKVWVGFALALPALIFSAFAIGILYMSVSEFLDRRRQANKNKSKDETAS